MLEYLILVLAPFAQGETRVQVRVYDGSVEVTVDSLIYPKENGVVWLEEQTAQRWLKALEDLRISGWRSSYQREESALDALSWSLEYKQAGKRCRHIGGQSAYPPNWLDFLAVMDCVAPILDPAQIDRLSLTVQYPLAPEDEPDACREFLVLDRGRGVLMLGSMRPDGSVSSQSYFAPEDVGMLLERCRALSWEWQGDTGGEEAGIPAYELELEYHKNGSWEKKGFYRREELPADWRALMDAVEAFRRSHAQSERMFSRRAYGGDLSGEKEL